MSVYVHVRYHVQDPEAYAHYRALAGPSVKAFGGSLVLKAASAAQLEGEEALSTLTILSFPSEQVAHDWYNSPAYQAAKQARAGAGEMRLEIVRG